MLQAAARAVHFRFTVSVAAISAARACCPAASSAAALRRRRRVNGCRRRERAAAEARAPEAAAERAAAEARAPEVAAERAAAEARAPEVAEARVPEVAAARAGWRRRMLGRRWLLWRRRRRRHRMNDVGLRLSAAARRYNAPLFVSLRRLLFRRRRRRGRRDCGRRSVVLLNCRRPFRRRTGRSRFWLSLRLNLGLRLRRHRALRGARRMAAEDAVLALAQRLGRRHVRRRRNRRGRALDGHWRDAPDVAFVSQLIAAHGDRALHAGGVAEHARAHVIGMERHLRTAGDEAGRQARIDPHAAALDLHRPVNDAGVAQDDETAVARHVIAAQLRLADVPQRHEAPILGVLVVSVDQIVRRHWRPADIVAAIAPVDPGRRPFVARHPKPAGAAVVRPAAVVIDHPAPVILGIVGNPVPAPVVRIDPMAVFVGPPVRRHAVRHPDFAVTCMADPMAIGVERGGHIVGALRHHGRQRARHDRHGHAGNGERKAGRGAEQEAASDVSVNHLGSPSAIE